MSICPPIAARRISAARALPLRWLTCALLAAPLWACQAQPPQQARVEPEQVLQQRITAEIGQAPCERDDQCRTLALGAKACGGPARWVAWSTTSTRIERLQPLADELAQRQRRREAAAGMVSDCRVVPDPGASCVVGRCVLAASDPSR